MIQKAEENMFENNNHDMQLCQAEGQREGVMVRKCAKCGEIDFPGYENKPCITAEKEQGRNEPCACGSGKKYKKCCGQEEAKARQLKAALLLKAFYVIIEASSTGPVTLNKGPMGFTGDILDEVPDNMLDKIDVKLLEDMKSIIVSMPKKEGEIIQPTRRIITG